MYSKVITLILFLLLPLTYKAQSVEDVRNFFEKNSNFILKKAHPNSELINSDVEVKTSYEDKYDFKIILDIQYKGFVKLHHIKCYVYFKEEPLKFVWGEDSNFFKIKTDADVVLEELKELWQKWSES